MYCSLLGSFLLSNYMYTSPLQKTEAKVKTMEIENMQKIVFNLCVIRKQDRCSFSTACSYRDAL